MAPGLFVEAFVSASVEVLLDRIISREFLDFFRSKDLDLSLLKKLKTALLTLQAVLNDAEEKQITNPAVKEWLDELRDAVFDADDLLDAINTEAMRCKMEGTSQSQPMRDQVWNFLSSPLKRFSGGINSEIQALSQRLEQFAQQKDILGLKEGVVSSRVWHGTQTSSVVDESAIKGRDDEKMKLKNYLLSEDASGNGCKIGVISIVGMSGLGKTTLANLLYNDHEVKKKFDPRGWAYISKDFDVRRVTTSILECVTSEPIVSDILNTLQVELQQSLSHKRFLLVLDDMWDGSYDKWNKLKAIFNAGAVGSKIIITTRDERVALSVQTYLPIHHLTSLPIEDCWSLLAHHAFGENKCREHSKLEAIGKKIAEKCGGLPLAAVALGGLLSKKLSEKEWNNVLKSNIWDLPDVDVLPALQLSYHYLPAPLKRCFAYCSIFPKNSLLDKKLVVLLWIAEGLVHESKSEKTMEEVGEEYFDELVLRSLIHRSSVDQRANFSMHDLMNDLATTVASSYCMTYEDRKPSQNLERIRHLSYKRGDYDYFNKFDIFYESKVLRTFIAVPLTGVYLRHYLSNKVVHDLLPAMRQLRVLSLSHYDSIIELPDSLGNLIHLRYLDLSWTKIKSLTDVICKLYNLQTLLLSYCKCLTELPDSIGNFIQLRYLDLSHTKIERLPDVTWRLSNLQTLLLSYCKCLTELPEDMGKLVNLRHLDISGTKLKKMPIDIAHLQNLQTLPAFVVSKQPDGLKVGELSKFPHLQGKLSVSKLQNVTKPSDAFQANLKKKEEIFELALEWDSGTTEDSQIERLVLKELQPSTNLKKLTIKSYGGTSFPNWLGDSSFGKMVNLCISDCDNCWSLPPLGRLLSLKELTISGMKSVKIVDTEFYGSSSHSFQPFPSLETLSFMHMPEWEEWKLIGGSATEFPSLRDLFLVDCPKLKGSLPSCLPSLIGLDLYDCPLLEGNLPSSLPSLIELELCDCPLLEGNLPSSLPSLTELVLSRCHILERNFSSNLPSLTSLYIHDCPLPVSGHSDEVDNSNIRGPSDLGCFNSLRCLSLTNIPSLRSFPRDGLPTTLKSLTVLDCQKLEFLPEDSWRSYSSLEHLEITNSCCSLTSFPLGCLPVLQELLIYRCENLKSISIEEDASHRLSFLQILSIKNCPKLESFPQGGLPAPNLVFFVVSGCWELNSLPEPINTLSGLQELRIDELPNLQSFAKEGLPINLRKLMVDISGSLSRRGISITEWGLQRLTCLSYLQLQGDDIVNALMKIKEALLPTSLVSLSMEHLRDVKCLHGKWLQHLTSLKNLEISYSDTLESLPEEGLPSSLSQLTIRRCPLLVANCKSNGGKEWPKIALIPCIIMEEQVII